MLGNFESDIAERKIKIKIPFPSILIILIIRVSSNNYKIIYWLSFTIALMRCKNEISKIKVNCNINI